MKLNENKYGQVHLEPHGVHPHKKFHYVVGADSASGLPNRDKSAYQVICLETHEQVAWFGEECAPNRFAQELRKIGTYFNNAIIGVELDKYGLLTNEILKDIYGNLYFHTEPPGGFGGGFSKQYGWKPTSTNRQVALDYLKMDFSANADESEAAKKGAIKIYDARTLEEMAFFVKDRETGKESAQRGKHDDLLAALWIANFLYHEFQIRMDYKEPEKEKGKSIVDEMKDWNKTEAGYGKGFGPRKLV